MSAQSFPTFIDVPALDLWRDSETAEMLRADVDFLMDRLALMPGAHALDIPCGNGRHSLELARHGVRVTGIGETADLVREACARADADRLAVRFFVGDAQRPCLDAVFDAAYCFGNRFGYIDYASTLAFLSAVARALRSGARFALDTSVAAESLLPTLQRTVSLRVRDLEVWIENVYNAEESRLDVRYIFDRHGERAILDTSQHVYTVAEIRRLFAAVGLIVEGVWSSPSEEPFVIGSRRLLLVARKQDPSDAAIRAQLFRILASDIFSRSDRLATFLRFIVEQTLQGRGDTLKEQVLAAELYGKGPDFTAAADPIVRVDARRLRDKLREYYVFAPCDAVTISVPKGGYMPTFEAGPVQRRERRSSVVGGGG